jgi:hypothetical protein
MGVRGQDRVADYLYDLGHDGVSEASKSVHPGGNPMSHSTHGGFNAPLVLETTIPKFNCLPKSWRRWIEGIDKLPRSSTSEADGVGQTELATASSNLPFASRGGNFRLFTIPSAERGVGHISSARMISVRFAPLLRRPLHGRGVGILPHAPAHFFMDGAFWFALAVGVCNNPYPVPPVRRTNGGSRYAVPLRVIPDLGQVSENTVKAPSKQSCDVLHDGVSGSNLANKTGVFAPEPGAVAIDAGALSGVADVLAGKTSADNVNWSSVDGARGLPVLTTLNNSPRPPLSASDALGVGYFFKARLLTPVRRFAFGVPLQPAIVRVFAAIGVVANGVVFTEPDVGPHDRPRRFRPGTQLSRRVSQRPDVVMDRHPRPMLRQHAPAERIDLAERHRPEPARPLQPEAEPADPAEQVQGPERCP